MSLVKSNTRWVLFLASSDVNPEDRHILDLVYGLSSLERAGIRPENISVYVDGKDRTNINNLFQIASPNIYNIQLTQDFFIDMQNNKYDNLVMFVTGHGSEKGIDAAKPITPYRLLESIKSSPKLDQAIIYLGQCFAGIFNYVKASRTGKNGPNIIFIGATELQESLSTSTAETFPTDPNPVSWQANLFLLHVFKWISSPFDVDGDSVHTIMDSYKYAGVMTNRSHKNIKANEFIRLMGAYGDLREAQRAAGTPTGNPSIDMMSKVRLQAMETQYLRSSYINNVHQECWILNSIPAQSIEI
ncbi:hypothetical protein [Vibrio nitrifigilis]|uniref:Peptidase C13 family protein n=1 Tax=Vibrio nitrifigilis TaxID=2789781 RepID=A0ABS0GI80_9VIBR|nr:hypothetical protein [Vibrio nitrifigilis]MBF9002005.1 hypothetical protein [Vibrio nitrifigilis]